jgi:microcin C transport system substrate-binding protein
MLRSTRGRETDLRGFLWILVGLLTAVSGASAQTTVSHGLSLFGAPKYGVDFKHFDYVRPDAPKGGSMIRHAIGSFDSLNPFILKGQSASGLGFVFETLTTRSAEESATVYGLLAETIETPADASWVSFTLRSEARFHDGSQVTAEDVVFSFDIQKAKGTPFFAKYYEDVVKAEALDRRRVRFVFSGGINRELPQIVGEMNVLSKAYWSSRDFERTTLEPPLGSGPYRVKAVDPGRSIVYERVADYWGRDLAVNRGRHNVDTIRIDYYRDDTVALEAFKAHQIDVRGESSAKNWATGYDFPAAQAGLVRRVEIKTENPAGMQAFVYNTRRAKFADPRVRAALAHAFDFEWSNQTLFYGAYARTRSYFQNSELASVGRPEGGELALLEPWRGKIPPEVFEREYAPPKTDGSGNMREPLRAALALLREAGWTIKDRRLVGPKGEAMEFEFLLVQPSFERVVNPMILNLEKLGVAARVRTIDTAQYRNRLDDFDFDVVVGSFGMSLTPGNELRDFFGQAASKIRGSRNLAGVSDPAVDDLIDKVIRAPDRESQIAAAKALDRVLLWGHYVIPHFTAPASRIAYWAKFGRPPTTPKYGLAMDAWWVDPAMEDALKRGEGQIKN